MSKIDEARTAWSNAVERMEDLDIQLQGLTDDSEPEIVQALEERFADAKAEALRKRHDYERAEIIAGVRSLQLPDKPAEGDESDGYQAADTGTLRRTGGRISVTKEENTYRPDNSNGAFYFRDLYNARISGDRHAQERLQRNQREIMVERRDLSSTDTAGGDFVSPLYMVNDWINVIRMGRPFANATNSVPLPDNTDTIIWPKVTSGSATSAQADLGAVQETDPVTTTVSVGVKTVAGQVDVSQQLLDRSQPGIDQILFADLLADYNVRLDLQALVGSGSGANAKGVQNDAARIQVTYTDASPTVAEFYSKVADATQQVLTNRGLPPDTIVFHPRRWGWIMAASDTTGRPLITPQGGATQTQPGTSSGPTDLGQPGFNFAGLNVVVDANITTTNGAGTNEDFAIVMRSADVMLAERANPTTRAHDQVLDANLAVRLQLFNYFAFTTERYSKAVATISGTGLVAPTF
jgi:HK97 family phage major capsid protein